MSEALLSREQLKQKAQDESDKADLQQHADKIIRAFENSGPTDARRALWELIQNARDLSTDARIEIALDPTELSFTHYGKTFNSNTLLCLVKQVSSKTRKKKEQKEIDEEIKEVGQYGTGFLTTHSIGKRFILDGTLKLQEGQFVSLKGFEINRTAKDSEELTDKLLIQQKQIFKLVEKGDIVESPSKTTFRYQFDLPNEKENAGIMFSETTESLIPIVMALNSSLTSISFENNIADPKYFRLYKKLTPYQEGNISVVPVQKDDEAPVNIHILEVNRELDLKIILPLISSSVAKALPETTSRLFLYFPLIGTENWGCNFIIHCGLFDPHAERDGIWIASNNAQNTAKEKNNQEIIRNASDAIFEFMEQKSVGISNAIYLANISFDTMSKDPYIADYFKKLKHTWVAKFRYYKIVNTSAGPETPSNCFFLAPELLEDKNSVESIYDLVEKFWPKLPLQGLVKDWTEVVFIWEDPDIKWITIKDICQKIQDSPINSIDDELLKSFYSYLLNYGHHKYFDEFRLLPTFGNNLAIRRSLFKSTPLHSLFIEMAGTFAPKVSNQLIKDEYIQQHSLDNYTRTELSKQLNPTLREISSKLNVGTLLTEKQKELLIRFCNSFPSIENKGARGDLMEVIISFYGLSIPAQHIPNVGEDKIDYSNAVECLIRHVIFDFATRATKDKDWVANNIATIKQLLVVLTNNKELSEHLEKMPIFVNRNLSLISRDRALIQKNMPELLKRLYFDILKKDKDDDLLHEYFEVFHKEGTDLEGSHLATDIMKYITEHGPIEAINAHPDAPIIMRIIKLISSKDKVDQEAWSKLFPAINAARASIVMAKIVEEKTKDSLFSIISLEDKDKISLLGELANDEQFELIVQYGKKALDEENTRHFDFDIKYKIGTHLEGILRTYIGEDLAKLGLEVKVLNEQKGKDIVVKQGDNILYYIEVKSRWRSTYCRFLSC